MPPRLPHGLKKDPTNMSRGELAIFGVLAGSVGLGVYQLVTSPWSEQKDDKAHAPAGEKKKEGTIVTVDDGTTKVHFEKR